MPTSPQAHKPTSPKASPQGACPLVPAALNASRDWDKAPFGTLALALSQSLASAYNSKEGKEEKKE